MNANSPFAAPIPVSSIDECSFYHVMDIPGHGQVGGLWDLRGRTDEYLGNFPFADKRVLEIGPASGFLTFEMEKRGARVVAVETTQEQAWDFVPFPDIAPDAEKRRLGMMRLRKSFWFTHAVHQSQAQVHYGDASRLPDELGHFDVAVMAAVLLHTRNPLQILEACAKRADAVVIVDLYRPDLEGQPICRFHPTVENRSWDTWWLFSTDLFRQFLSIVGFKNFIVSTHTHDNLETTPPSPTTFFTLIATKV